MNNTEKDTKYKVIKFLGSGSYSNVYKCQTPSGDIVAVKKIKYDDKKGDIDIRKEIKSHNIMRHNNIVKFYKYIFGSSVTYIVMECCENTLRDILKKKKKLDIQEIRYSLRSIIEGIRYIHKLGYIHRDIKLRNILLTQNGEIKIGDFGFCIHKNEVKIGRVAGTPNYLAPELIIDRKSRKEDDIWSTGVIIYALYFGKIPWSKYIDDRNELNKQITSFKVKYLDNSEVTKILKHILVPKENRYSSSEILKSSFIDGDMHRIL